MAGFWCLLRKSPLNQWNTQINYNQQPFAKKQSKTNISRLEGAQEKGKNLHAHFLPRESERENTHTHTPPPTKHNKHAIICLQAAPLLQFLPPQRRSFIPSCSRRTLIGDNNSLLLPLPCFGIIKSFGGLVEFCVAREQGRIEQSRSGVSRDGSQGGRDCTLRRRWHTHSCQKGSCLLCYISQFWICCCWFPFSKQKFSCRESLCGEWISRFVRSGYE